MDKLELKHLSCYLPYGLKMIFESKGGRIITLTGITDQGAHGITITSGQGAMWLQSCGFKPILRPLSDYFDITSPAMNELNLDLGDQIWLANLADCTYHVDELPYRLACTLAEEHIDFMGLIPAGLAISYKEAGL